ncbi:hypothetical protein [Flaviaesturariibacter flavus]|uniref:hypothetical protein n=1 Tax=Flaviaesturariibacter flavus TaxID=2502780 RepID=UPI0014044086|nr:hypothetical protein [Flaviaesturariibacter flavus]
MEKPKAPVVIPPQQEARPDTITAPDPQPASDGSDPYVPPVEKQENRGAGSEISDGEDA